MKYAIDRIEKGMARCENLDTGKEETLPISFLPSSAKEGDVLDLSEDRTALWDQAATESRRQRARKRLDRLLK